MSCELLDDLFISGYNTRVPCIDTYMYMYMYKHTSGRVEPSHKGMWLAPSMQVVYNYIYCPLPPEWNETPFPPFFYPPPV